MGTQYRSFVNFGPGDFIQEELEFRDWTQEDLAEIMGMSTKSISHIINHKQQITLETAKKLSGTFGQSPQYWLNSDINYRLRHEAEDQNSQEIEEIHKKSYIYEHMPIKDMINMGWLNDFDDINELERQVLAFWNKSKLNFSFLEEYPLPNFRKSERYSQYNKYYALTWCKKAKIELEKTSLPKFDRDAAKELSKSLIENSYKLKIEDCIKQTLESLNEVGIGFLVQPHLPKTYLDGAAISFRENPIIVYTARYDRLDNFWFTLAHELGHILLHLKSNTDVFLDDLSEIKTSDRLEQEADEFANEMIKAPEILKFFKDFGPSSYVTKTRIRDCARYFLVHESVIVGMLQYNGILDWNRHNDFKSPVTDLIPNSYFAN